MTDQSTFHIPKPGLPSFSIQGENGTVLMRLDPDGTITFSSLIEAQEAGRIFVDTVRQYLKPMADLVAENERLKTDLEDARRLAARVLDEQTFAKTYDILKELTFTYTDETGDVSVVGIGHAAEAVLAYLKGRHSDD